MAEGELILYVTEDGALRKIANAAASAKTAKAPRRITKKKKDES
jgi:hypothetical protein